MIRSRPSRPTRSAGSSANALSASRIEHERAFALVEQLAHECRHRFAATESGTRDDHVRINAEDGIGGREMHRAGAVSSRPSVMYSAA